MRSSMCSRHKMSLREYTVREVHFAQDRWESEEKEIF